jgi:RNA-directed DNA polymerase
LKKISGEVRGWRLHRKVNYTFAGLATMINPIVAGWTHYYGRFRRSAMYPLLARINAYLVRWIRKKYRRLQGAHKANRKLREITGCDAGSPMLQPCSGPTSPKLSST